MKVLYVCDGNICRSPLAAEYTRARSVHSGLSHLVVDSAGLLGIEGSPAAPLSIAVASEEGFDLSRHRSRGVRRSDIQTADLVVAMTLRQLETLAARFPAIGGRRVLIRAFEGSPVPSGGAPELDDPVTGPVEDYRAAFATIRACVDHLLLHLKHAS